MPSAQTFVKAAVAEEVNGGAVLLVIGVGCFAQLNPPG